MNTYGTMSNQEIVEAYRKIIRLSEMRTDMMTHSFACEFVSLADEVRNIWDEAELRYGPGIIRLQHLIDAQGPHYRRIREKSNV